MLKARLLFLSIELEAIYHLFFNNNKILFEDATTFLLT